MAELLLRKGDWIVHKSYGVGQIRKIETKPIHGKEVNAFRVKTKTAVYWLPIKKSG